MRQKTFRDLCHDRALQGDYRLPVLYGVCNAIAAFPDQGADLRGLQSDRAGLLRFIQPPVYTRSCWA